MRCGHIGLPRRRIPLDAGRRRRFRPAGQPAPLGRLGLPLAAREGHGASSSAAARAWSCGSGTAAPSPSRWTTRRGPCRSSATACGPTTPAPPTDPGTVIAWPRSRVMAPGRLPLGPRVLRGSPSGRLVRQRPGRREPREQARARRDRHKLSASPTAASGQRRQGGSGGQDDRCGARRPPQGVQDPAERRGEQDETEQALFGGQLERCGVRLAVGRQRLTRRGLSSPKRSGPAPRTGSWRAQPQRVTPQRHPGRGERAREGHGQTGGEHVGRRRAQVPPAASAAASASPTRPRARRRMWEAASEQSSTPAHSTKPVVDPSATASPRSPAASSRSASRSAGGPA